MPTHERTGDVSKGGFWVHYRDGFNSCQHAFVTAVVKGQIVNLQVIKNGPDQLQWIPMVTHGSGKGQWHFPDQCAMTDAEMRADEARAHLGRS